jgi:hypothetical protein
VRSYMRDSSRRERDKAKNRLDIEKPTLPSQCGESAICAAISPPWPAWSFGLRLVRANIDESKVKLVDLQLRARRGRYFGEMLRLARSMGKVPRD